MSGYEELRSGVAWLDLTGRGLIRVTGDDRARLLHAMSTNHVQALQPGAGLYTFFLSAQGRILADAYVFNLGDSILLDTEPELRQKLQEHLDKYIIADDCTLEDETQQWSVFGIEGPDSLTRAHTLGLPVPQEPLGVAAFRQATETLWSARVASSGPAGIRIWVPHQLRGSFLQMLHDTTKATADEARVVRLENSLPRYGEEITERYLVQETGVVHGVHPSKGCYLGQEIVERVRSRAQVHRHLKSILIDGTIAPVPGTKLSTSGKDVAEVVSAAFSPANGGVVGFAYVRTEALDGTVPLQVAGSEPAAMVRLR